MESRTLVPMIRKYTSLLLVAVLLVHLAGFYVYFVVRLGDLRMSMREKISLLPAEQLEVIRVPAASFRKHWLEEREMEWQGNMYDIARVEQSGEEILVYGLHDKDEDGLLNFIGAVVDMAHQDPQPAPAPVVQFLALKYVISHSILPAVEAVAEAPSLPFTIPATAAGYSQHHTPPPRA